MGTRMCEAMITHHAVSQLTFEGAKESFLIMPNFQEMAKAQFADAKFLAGVHRRPRKVISTKFQKKMHVNSRKLTESVDEFSTGELHFRSLFGAVKSTEWNPERKGFMVSVFENQYHRWLLSDEKFLADSVLPADILNVIFSHFLGSVDTKTSHYNILQIVGEDSGLLCQRLPPSKTDLVQHCGLKFCGKYFRLQTTLKIVDGPYFSINGGAVDSSAECSVCVLSDVFYFSCSNIFFAVGN